MLIGNDYLAGVLYADTMMKAHYKGDVGGIFLTTFKKNGKNAKETVVRMLKSKAFSELVVHIAPFDRLHRYPIGATRKQVLDDSKWLNKQAKAYPGTKVYVSPFCEHNHPARVMKPLFDDIRRVAPDCILLNSIWKGEEVPGTVTEIHIPDGTRLPRVPKNPYTVAFDGIGSDGNGDFADFDLNKIMQKYATALHVRAWGFRHNGKFGDKDTADVNHRVNMPSVEYLRQHRNSLLPREGGLWDDSKLYKAVADDHGGDLSKIKDCRAMAILPGGLQGSVKVYDSKGNHIDTLTPPKINPEHNGLPKGIRYYSKKYAYQIANIAKRNTGSYLIKIRDYPLIDGKLRSGKFR